MPRLEEKLNLLATIAQLAPLIGLLGTVLGFIQTFGSMQKEGLNAHIANFPAESGRPWSAPRRDWRWRSPLHAAYNYLVSRINSIVLDMERAATEIVQIVTEGAKPPPQP